MDDKRNGNVRFNITMVMIYIVGIILLIRLFNIQIVHGEEYRSESNTRLTRETTLKAARGSILDSSGNKLVSTTVEYNVEIYKTKIDADTLNQSLLLFAQTLEANGDKYVDEFPIKINPYTYVGSNFESWKKANKINESATEEEAFNYFKNRYKVSTDSLENDRRVITLRYAIELNGYSSTRSVTIAKNIGNVTRDTLNVMSENYPGISTSSKPTTQYNYGELASHILGYVGPISDSELKANSDYDSFMIAASQIKGHDPWIAFSKVLIIKDEVIYRRVRHCVTENDRVLKAVDALKTNNLEELGRLLYASHNSLRDDYEVTGIELDTLVEVASKQPGCIGARMTGAGFGGCAIALVHKDKTEDFIKNVQAGYSKVVGYEGGFFACSSGDGVREIC